MGHFLPNFRGGHRKNFEFPGGGVMKNVGSSKGGGPEKCWRFQGGVLKMLTQKENFLPPPALINDWSLNEEKSYYILFHRTRIKTPHIHIDICMNNSVLKQTNCIKYLGVFIDSKLSWIQHINYVKNKVSKCVGIMYKARRYLSKNSLVNLYHSFVYPYLIYCIEVWGNASECHLDQLFLMQKKIIRIITFQIIAYPQPYYLNHSIFYQ